MIRLFLEGHEVELNESVQFAITKQFEDITSPADIKNDFSKTVEIPFSQKNNKIFGMLFSVDRLIPMSSGQLTGIYFNPYKKIDFRLQWNDTVLLQGYAKIINVKKLSNGQGYYSISLNGELGKVFQEMKKITFDTKTEDQQYLIDGSKYVSEQINKELIYNLWTENIVLDQTLKENTDSGYKLNNIINFAPNNSFDSDFKYNLYQYTNTDGEDNSKTFAVTLDEKAKTYTGSTGATYENVSGVPAETIIGNGLLAREIGEYRSWLQLPYIYFNQLFQIFMKKTEQITGYTTELDPSWFNNKNPYWSKLVYMLKRLFSDRENEETKTTYTKNISGVALLKTSGNWKTFTSWLSSTNKEQQNRYYPDRSTLYDTNISNEILVVCEKRDDGVWYGLNNTSGIEIEIGYYDELKGTVYNVNKYLLVSPTSTYSYNSNSYTQVLTLPNANNDVLRVPFNFDSSCVGQSYLTYRWRFVGTTDTFFFFNSEGEPNTEQSSSAKWVGGDIRVGFGTFDKYSSFGNVYWTTNNSTINSYEGVTHTNVNFTLNDLWDNNYNIFDEILDYCKMYRIGVFCDDINKKLIFKPLSKYFSEYKIIDWTDKLVINKEYNIQPITFENKYLLFNYNGLTKLNDIYKEKYGVNYGEYKLSTDYEFNTNTKNVFNGINNGICNTDSILSWGNLYDKMNFIYTIPKEVMVYNKNKDNKNVNLFGCMFLYNGLTKFDSSEPMRPVKISDDTRLQEVSREFFYSQNVNTTPTVATYPYLNVKQEGNYNICLFKTPAESYIYSKDYFDNTIGIYDNFWKNYVNERYNVQNKMVTCYLKLTPFDVANFQYNHFVKIENQLYFVNKIYDYQIDENIPTKVDLITIQDINGYTDTNFVAEILFFLKDRNHTEWEEGWSYVVVNEDPIYVTSTTRFKIEMSENLDVPDFELYIGGDLYKNGDYCDYADDLGVSFWYDPGSLPDEREEGWVKFTNEYGTTITIPVIIKL